MEDTKNPLPEEEKSLAQVADNDSNGENSIESKGEEIIGDDKTQQSPEQKTGDVSGEVSAEEKQPETALISEKTPEPVSEKPSEPEVVKPKAPEAEEESLLPPLLLTVVSVNIPVWSATSNAKPLSFAVLMLASMIGNQPESLLAEEVVSSMLSELSGTTIRLVFPIAALELCAKTFTLANEITIAIAIIELISSFFIFFSFLCSSALLQ